MPRNPLGHSCTTCGTVWPTKPKFLRCEGCRVRLCPACEIIYCECGGLFCRQCVNQLDDAGHPILLCDVCREVASICDSCGGAPADLIAEDRDAGSGYHADIWLCAACYLSRRRGLY